MVVAVNDGLITPVRRMGTGRIAPIIVLVEDHRLLVAGVVSEMAGGVDRRLGEIARRDRLEKF